MKPILDADALIARWIGRDPNHPGLGDACVHGEDFSIHVWAIAGDLPVTGHSPRVIAQAWEIPAEAALAALYFYARHRPVVDDRLRQNEVMLEAIRKGPPKPLPETPT